MNENEVTTLPDVGQRTRAVLPDIVRSSPPSDASVYQFAARQPATARQLPRHGALSVVGLRVDGLTIAAVVGLEPARLASWTFPRDNGSSGPGVVGVELAGWAGVERVELAVRPVRADRWYFENADVQGIVDRHPLAGCHLEVKFAAVFLATNKLDSAVAYVEAIAATLGVLLELRTRKLDMAADVAGWEIKGTDRLGFVKPGRSPLTTHMELPEEEGPRSMREHGALRLTGHTIGAGGSRLARIYDKRVHLAEKCPDKLALEESIWRANGWTGETCVTRAEFQLRSEALREYGIVSPVGLESKLDALWQSMVQDWLRLVEVGSATRSCRGRLDPRWQLLQACTFVHESHPALRSSVRGGSTLAQALGVWMSYTSARLDLSESDPEPCASEGSARECLGRELARWTGAGVRLMVSELLERLGSARAALEWVRQRGALSTARASTVGGGAAPPPAQGAPDARQKRARPRVDLRIAA